MKEKKVTANLKKKKGPYTDLWSPWGLICSVIPENYLTVSLMHSLEDGKATHSSILAWRIPWTEEPAGLQHNQATKHSTATHSNKTGTQ